MLSFEHFSSGVAAADFLSIDQYTHAVQWAERIKARPAVTRGLQVLSFELLFLIHLCCLLNNYFSYNNIVFWTYNCRCVVLEVLLSHGLSKQFPLMSHISNMNVCTASQSIEIGYILFTWSSDVMLMVVRWRLEAILCHGWCMAIKMTVVFCILSKCMREDDCYVVFFSKVRA